MSNRDAAIPLPQSGRPTASAPGHWVLARAGKRVLRPGGAALTTAMLARAELAGAQVVEFAPGLGRTATEICKAPISRYTGVDQDPDAAARVSQLVAAHGHALQADARNTGLPDASADVVVGEAMLSMQSDKGKRQIIAEAVRLLRPGGRYAIHELGLRPDDVAEAVKADITKNLARAIHVNARPLTRAEWTAMLTDAGLVVDWVGTAPMALLKPGRNLRDEGVRGVARILFNVLRDRDLRRRVLTMRATFNKYKSHLEGIAIVAHRPEES